jgi:uncharacterized protein YhhL (DUF1145 family)
MNSFSFSMKDRRKTSSSSKVLPSQNNLHQPQYSQLPSQPIQTRLAKRSRLSAFGVLHLLRLAQGNRHHMKGDDPQTYHQPWFLSRILLLFIAYPYPNCLQQVLEVLCPMVVLQKMQLQATMASALPRPALSLPSPPTPHQSSQSSHFRCLLNHRFGRDNIGSIGHE